MTIHSHALFQFISSLSGKIGDISRPLCLIILLSKEWGVPETYMLI